MNPFITSANFCSNPYSIDLPNQSEPSHYCFGESVSSNVMIDVVFLR